MSDQILWFATRGAGVVSLLLFTAVTCLGLLTVVRWQSESWPRFLTAELHRSLALLSVVFLGAHIATAILDPFTSLGIAAATIPFASSYRPLWVGLGVISMDLILALIVTSLLRERIGQRAWRTVHWASYAAWPLALAHGLGAGSDAFAPWFIAIEVACVVVVGVSLLWRLSIGWSNRGRLRGAVAAGSARVATPFANKDY
jgi:methionine sulfoxide reductase heme-binding subunit